MHPSLPRSRSLSHPTPSLAGTVFLHLDLRKPRTQKLCRGGQSLKAITGLLFLSVSPVTPKGSLAKVCSLDFVFSPCALPS